MKELMKNKRFMSYVAFLLASITLMVIFWGNMSGLTISINISIIIMSLDTIIYSTYIHKYALVRSKKETIIHNLYISITTAATIGIALISLWLLVTGLVRAIRIGRIGIFTIDTKISIALVVIYAINKKMATKKKQMVKN